jgi:hypothetical protein
MTAAAPIRESVATKADIVEVKRHIGILDAKLQTMMAEIKADIVRLKWITYASTAGIATLIVKAFFG